MSQCSWIDLWGAVGMAASYTSHDSSRSRICRAVTYFLVGEGDGFVVDANRAHSRSVGLFDNGLQKGAHFKDATVFVKHSDPKYGSRYHCCYSKQKRRLVFLDMVATVFWTLSEGHL